MSERIDLKALGIDLDAILEEIREDLGAMTRAELGQRAGLAANNVRRMLNKDKPTSLGALAAMASALGGKIEVRYVRPRKRRAS